MGWDVDDERGRPRLLWKFNFPRHDKSDDGLMDY